VVAVRGEIDERHATDSNGYPAGGQSTGRGFVIHWQDGPLAVNGERREPNGAFVEDIIAAAIGRIEFYERTAGGRFSCQENIDALAGLRRAADRLDDRTRAREARGVEGTHAQ
jgi:hypothetical protein